MKCVEERERERDRDRETERQRQRDRDRDRERAPTDHETPFLFVRAEPINAPNFDRCSVASCNCKEKQNYFREAPLI